MGYDGICSACGFKGDVSPYPSLGQSLCGPCAAKYLRGGRA